MPRLSKHRHQCRPRPATIVESAQAGAEPVKQRINELRQKPAIAWIIRIVFVEQIVGVFVLRRRSVAPIKEARLAALASPVVATFNAQKVQRRRRAADRAGGGSAPLSGLGSTVQPGPYSFSFTRRWRDRCPRQVNGLCELTVLKRIVKRHRLGARLCKDLGETRRKCFVGAFV